MVETTLLIGVPILVGLIIGILEAYFVYEDEPQVNGQDFIHDIIHGIAFAIIGVLVAVNVTYLLTVISVPEFIESFLYIDENGISLSISIFITLFMYLKMVTSHAIKGLSSNGFTEKPIHKITIASLIGFSGYYISMLIPMLIDYVPSFLL